MANVGHVTGAEYEATVERLRQRSLDCLAPKFRERLEAAVADATHAGLDPIVFETCRTDELARLYFAHGVSQAPNALHTWHHYGLAADVISKARGWDVYPGPAGSGGDRAYVELLVKIFKAHSLDWGGDWHSFRDFPHWQFGGIRPSPLEAPTILATRGIRAVWETVGAV
jgi:hypothetical protein